MRVRLGFVSNSSSSSFTVIFPKEPDSAEEIQELLFGDRQIIEIHDHRISASDAAQTIWEDIQEDGPSQRFSKNKAKMDNWFRGNHFGPDSVEYKFEYADEDGAYYVVMEHGNIFGTLPHKRVSNH